MKKRIKNTHKKLSKKAILFTIAAFALLGTALLVFTKAATNGGSLSLTPPSGSFTQGNEFTVAVKEDSQAIPVFSVGLKLSYDATKLDVVSVTGNGAFPNCPDASGSGGTIKVSCYISPGANPNSVTGLQTVANVKFKAKVGGSISTAVTYIGPPTADYGIFSASDGSNIWDGNTTSSKGTYILNSVSTPPPSGGDSSGSGGTGSSGGTGTTPKTTTTTPTTTTPSTSSTTPKTTTTTPTTTTSDIATNSNPTVSESSASVYRVAILITDQESKAVAGANVTIGDMKVSTDALGVANFSNLKPGNYKVKVSSVSGTADQTIAVLSNQSIDTVQQFKVQVKKTFNVPLIFISLIFVTAILGVMYKYLKPKYDRLKSNRQHNMTPPEPLPTDKIDKVRQMGEFVPIISPAAPETKPTAEIGGKVTVEPKTTQPIAQQTLETKLDTSNPEITSKNATPSTVKPVTQVVTPTPSTNSTDTAASPVNNSSSPAPTPTVIKPTTT